MESDVITLQDLFEFKLESIAADRTIIGVGPADRSAPDVPEQVREARHRAAGKVLRQAAEPARRRRARAAMTGRRTRAAATLVAAALVAAGALAAAADGAGSASGVPGSRRRGVSHFPDMAFTLALPKQQPLTAAQVQVTENGSPGPGRQPSRSREPRTSASSSLIDASNSMKGEPITQAMAAARAFAARRNPGQQLALITFNDKATVVLPLTSDHGDDHEGARARAGARDRHAHLRRAPDRRPAARRTPVSRPRSIVLLSDGKDVGSNDRPGDRDREPRRHEDPRLRGRPQVRPVRPRRRCRRSRRRHLGHLHRGVRARQP